jgi:outer membrane receptor protein involved in Fe transport
MKKINAIYLALMMMCLLLSSISVLAQTSTTGTIEGTVTDTNGAVVPNATVVINGGGLLRPQTTTSDNNGTYRFFQVPPGKYTVKVESSAGFDSFEQSNVEVNLSKSTNVNISLKPKGVGATVDVVASSPEIDTTNNVSGTNVSTEFFSNIPTSRTVQGLYTIAPTVARSGLRDASGRDRDPSVGGSSGPENNYILDGVNATDPAFGGSGANIPFEFVQEVEIKTGAYGADQGLATGGVFNVITKSGGNEFHGDVFGYFSNKSLVAATKNFGFTDLASNGFSELDAGVDVGGPIIKNRLTFFAAFNPQYRKNFSLTQTFRQPVESKIQTPFYAGKVTWLINNSNTFTASTFGDYTKEEGHLFAANTADSGFGANLKSFQGVRETGGTNYAFRLNSVLRQNWIGEFSFGIHRQRNNLISDPAVADKALVNDTFAVLKADGTVANVTQTGIAGPTNTGFVDYVFSPNGSLQRNFVRDGFGAQLQQNRNRWEAAARLQTVWEKHTIKYGFEFYQNAYDIDQASTGPNNTFANPLNVPSNTNTPSENTVSGFTVANNFSVCTTRGVQIVCPSATATTILSALPLANLPTGITSVVTGSITAAEANNNPFLVRTTTRVRSFELHARSKTNVESFYIQDDWRVNRSFQLNIGARWDYQQAIGNGGITYIKLNDWFDNLQPRVGWIWDFTGEGKGKIFMNFARYLETPIPLDVNVRAGSADSQTDKNFNVNSLNAPLNSSIATGFNVRNLGSHPTPIDQGLRPQTVNEFNVGFEYEVKKNLAFGVRGIYRAQDSVIEDGSFDDGDNYFLFNPGEIRSGDNTTEELACNNPAVGCFGRARRYYRALEFTLNRRFANRYSFVSSYVYSSLIGNYEGLFRNDNGQADPNITSLFDLVSLLANAYGRLPNDRPHQFKFNGSYETPFKLMVSGNFYIQSGTPFDQLIPHVVYGNNEGFGVPRGTAVVPTVNLPGASGGVSSAIGNTRSPTTFNLDLGFYYPIHFSENKQLRFTADWFNVTNTQRAVTMDKTFLINSGVTGVPPVSNPFYGTGIIFQSPSSLRLGAKFIF